MVEVLLLVGVLACAGLWMKREARVPPREGLLSQGEVRELFDSSDLIFGSRVAGNEGLWVTFAGERYRYFMGKLGTRGLIVENGFAQTSHGVHMNTPDMKQSFYVDFRRLQGHVFIEFQGEQDPAKH
jgi:hypothetical protein